ncbi:MAG: class I SAM-dependent methyltransferase [Segniliparus sp.]|uniref:class I SAM-dependent methyltransferase n=1 Tax=Segniliparus sp. TaxID=2804064 RepID=UPI003F3867E9
MTNLRPFYEDIEAHYDLSNDFFALWLDPTMTYTCAYWPEPGMTLEEAQLAKLDLTLEKLKLKPGMTLLDIGCGWGSALLRAYEKYDVNVIGITISTEQYEHVKEKFAQLKGPRTAEVRLQGWEEFDGKADRIVTIGAFEHFRYERHEAFWDKISTILPDDGMYLLHTIVSYGLEDLQKRGTPLTPSMVRFSHLIGKYIFPGAQLPTPQMVLNGSARIGLRCDLMQVLGWHYAKTLDAWRANLNANKEKAVELTSSLVYDQYDKYMESCAHYFRVGNIDLIQFTLTKQQPEWLRPAPGAMENFTAAAR